MYIDTWDKEMAMGLYVGTYPFCTYTTRPKGQTSPVGVKR
jgi:hypothetical protein